MSKFDDINVPLVATVGLLSVLAVVGTVIGVQALYYNFAESEFRRKVVDQEAVQARNLVAEQEAKLQRMGWLNREKGEVAIPIERAMKLVVKELSAEAVSEQGENQNVE